MRYRIKIVCIFLKKHQRKLNKILIEPINRPFVFLKTIIILNYYKLINYGL